MTDRDPIAAALEDLRTKEAAEREQEAAAEKGPFEHFQIVEPPATVDVPSLPLDQLTQAFSLIVDADVGERWEAAVASYPANPNDALLVVRPREAGNAEAIRARLAADGLVGADGRELCAFKWKRTGARFSWDRLFAMGQYLLTGMAGGRRTGRFLFRSQLSWGGDCLDNTDDAFLDELTVYRNDFLLVRRAS